MSSDLDGPDDPPITAQVSSGESPTRKATLLLALGVGVAVFALVGLLAVSPSGETRIYSSALDEVAPVTVGVTMDGSAFDLRDLRGQWVLVNFFATWCAGCIQEHPELVEFSERHRPVGDASVVSVVYEDNVSDVEEFFVRRGGEWPVIVGDDGSISLEYGVIAVPESYLVAPSGRVVAKFIGATGVTADNLDATIASLSGGSDA